VASVELFSDGYKKKYLGKNKVKNNGIMHLSKGNWKNI